MKAEYGEIYRIWVPGEPVPKSTQRPPSGTGAYHIVMKSSRYVRLAATWKYQKHVAEYAQISRCPTFEPSDPISMSLHIFKTGHKTGDAKNIWASVEDGLQYGGYIPNDRQVVSDDIKTDFKVGIERAGVLIAIEICPRVVDAVWLAGWLGSKKKAIAYQARKGI